MTREATIKCCLDLSESTKPELHERYLRKLDDQTLAERVTLLQSQAKRILPSRGENCDWHECENRKVLPGVHGRARAA